MVTVILIESFSLTSSISQNHRIISTMRVTAIALILVLILTTMTTTRSQLTEEEFLIAQWFSRNQERENNNFETSSNEERDAVWIPVKKDATTEVWTTNITD